MCLFAYLSLLSLLSIVSILSIVCIFSICLILSMMDNPSPDFFLSVYPVSILCLPIYLSI